MKRPLRCGLVTPQLLSVLAAIAVLAFLAMIILPGACCVRDGSSRSGRCLSNMRQVAFAMLAYESRSSSSYYPGYRNYLELTDGTSYKANAAPYPKRDIGTEQAVSWAVTLLPYLDRIKLYESFRDSRMNDSAGQKILMNYPYLEILVCPSDPPPGTDRAPISIVVNTGMRDGRKRGQRDYRANGVFHDHYTDHPARTKQDVPPASQVETVNNAFIDRQGDGVQYTLLLSENVDAGSYLDTDERFVGMTWGAPLAVDTSSTPYSAMLPAKLRRINENKGDQLSEIADLAEPGGSGAPPLPLTTTSYEDDDDAPYHYYARPSSPHPNGVNVAFCDGHALFISDRIDYYVYTLLMTPQGQEVRDPNTGRALQLDGYSGTKVGPPMFDRAWLFK